MQLRQHDAIKSKADVFKVDPRQLKTDPGFNVRDLDAAPARPALDELKDSIRAEGVQVPLEIRLVGEDLFITSGHRRHKVVMELIAEGVEIETVPAIAEPKAVNDADRVARLITLNAGEPLTQLEKAEVVKRLLGYGWDRAKIAQRLGLKSLQTVANAEILLSAPEEVREAVREGELAATEAVSLVRAEGPRAAETVAKAREVARASGKSKITGKSLPPRATRPPAATQAPLPPAPVRNQGDLERALVILQTVIVGNDYKADAAASVFGAVPLDDVTAIIEWMMDFETKLKAKANGHASPFPTDTSDVPAVATEEG